MIKYDNKDWFRQLFAIKGTVIGNIYGRVIFFILWTTLVCIIYHKGYLSENEKIDMVVFNVVGLALGLLLVFRTNTSYDRYWEGRKLLGSLTNSTRNASIILNKITPKEDKAAREYYYKMLSSFFYATKEHLRDGVKEEHIQQFMPDEIKSEILQHRHIPIAILDKLVTKSNEFKKLPAVSEADMIALNNELFNMSNNLGGMERIKNTPVPFAYASHLQFFVMLYFITLPFGLYDKFHWLSVPVIGIVSFILLGINEIGVEIEDPFGDDPNDLPSDTLCENAEKLVKDILL